jgi:hypothetical protein
MRGILSVDDFIKLAAGLIAGLLVLAVIWIVVSNYVSTLCWRNEVKPFDDNILGVQSIQGGLGSKDRFIIYLSVGSPCLKEISLSKNRYYCDSRCKASGLSSSVVESCSQDCYSKCDNGCIALIPTGQFIKDALSGDFGFNSPRIYGSSDYKLTWDSVWDNQRITGAKNAKGKNWKCMIFQKSASSKEYSITVQDDDSSCK